jgi:thiol-disulfide isomerase/thioredoxin
MPRPSLALFLACFALSCGKAGPSSPAGSAPAKTEAARTAPTLIQGISWFEDAPAAAQAEAARTGKPVLVDLWAPWCHTCLSMKNFVLTREHLGEQADQLLFLSINTERRENAEFLRHLPVDAWPTFYVADARDWSARGRWVGAASPAQFTDFLRDGKRAFELSRQGSLANDPALSALLRGDQQVREQKLELAAQSYAEAVERGGVGWPRRPDALVAQISALSHAGKLAECASLGEAHMGDTGTSVSAVDFAYYALSCAEQLPPSDAQHQPVQKLAEARLSAACESSTFALTPDDRSDACATLHDARESLGDLPGARKAAEQRLSILEHAKQGLPDDMALTYDWAHAETLLWLERGSEALPFLSARERALPDNYNPPHYLARVYKALGKWSDGLAAIERALEKAYGPRKASMLGLKVDLLLGAGERSTALEMLEAQLAMYRDLPEVQRSKKAEAAVQSRLAAWK